MHDKNIYEHPIGQSVKPARVTADVNPVIKKLLTTYIGELESKRKYTPIHVDEITSKVARFYETIRKVVDWKDDNALRRGAIERILKRILFTKVSGFSSKDVDVAKLSERVAVELIRGGHLPNDTVPVERLTYVETALAKYVYFLEFASSYKALEVKKRINFANFVLEVAACEIEEILTNPVKEYSLIEAMAKVVDGRVSVEPSGAIDEETRQKYVFVSVCRALFDLDDNFIIYHLLGGHYPNWHNPSLEETKSMAKTLHEDWRSTEEQINDPVVNKFVAVSETVDTIFVLINDVLENLKDKPGEVGELFGNKKKLWGEMEKAYEKRYKTLKRRLFRLGIFSTLSVFLSNWFTFFVVEIPLAQLFYERFNKFAAIADFLIPTFVMFVLVMIIRPPGRDNIKKVKAKLMGIVYEDEKQEQFRIKISKGGFSLFKVIMYTFYLYSMVVVFSLVAYVFYIATLPLTSVVFDTFTIALTVYAAVTIKHKARELNVDQHTSMADFLLDIISVPVAKVGSIFASKWKEYNLAAILFNFLVETPFVAILDFIQEWSEFMRERKAELR